MTLRGNIRNSAPFQTNLEIFSDRLEGSQVIDIHKGERYLQLLLKDPHGVQREAIINVDSWLLEISDKFQLPDIPWYMVPLEYLVRWLSELTLSFSLYEHHWDVHNINTLKQSLPDKLLSLPSLPSALLCTEWPFYSSVARDKCVFPLPQVTFIVKYVLGYSHSVLSEVTKICVGDLWLIKKCMTRLVIGKRHIFQFKYYKEQEIIVEELCEENYKQKCHDIKLDDWSDLPVEMEFVLDNQVVTLADLNDYKSGVILPISPGAEKRVKIFLNNKLFARGELVGLDDGSLAVEINHVVPALTGISGSFDD